MGLFLLRRFLTGSAVVLVTALFAYGGFRYLRNDMAEYAGVPWLDGTWEELKRFFVHRDFGQACMYAGCPDIRDLFNRGWQADLWMLAGAVGFGSAAGVAGGLWCAAHPRALRSRVLEAVAMVLLCAPPFVLGFGLLLLFEPTFGRVHMPLFFDVHVYQQPYENPWDWFRALLVPWSVAGAPIAAVCLRLTLSAAIEHAEEDYMRTAIAKGLPFSAVMRRHARPIAEPSVFAFVGTSSALIVTNVLITEAVFSVPGFLVHTRRAFGKVPGYPEFVDHHMLQALAVWGAVLIVGLAIISDFLVMSRDPRVRARG
jgi:ABC-type dipeptide/oligopeptide/nickel transport system permease component